MNASTLSKVLRQVLLTSVSAPLALGFAGCGGRSVEVAGGQDAATTDGAVDGEPPLDGSPDASCGNQACGIDCRAGCTPYRQCVNGTLECGCDCPDASVVDVIVVDATDPCSPNKMQCPYYIPLSCTDASVGDAAGWLPPQECMQICEVPTPGVTCEVSTGPGGEPAVACYDMCIIVGRRPAGLRGASRKRAPATTEPSVGRYFADVARLEAAAAHAFRAMRAELVAHGAPRRLRAAAGRAARDEVRHARVTARVARRFGATAERAHVVKRGVRPLEVIALENAVEGCVRETFGALTAMHQARAARDPAVRAMMRRIAVDETRHAALGWQVAAWAEEHLGAAGRARVDEARRRAVRELRAELAAAPPDALRTTAGLPDADAAQRMLDAMGRALGC